MIFSKSETNFSSTTTDQNLILTNATLMTAPALLHPADITSVNSFLSALKYTWEISENSLPFLDIKLSINDNCLFTSVHYKRTDAHNYLLHWSFRPRHVKNTIPFSQFLIRRNLCSDDSDFNNKCDEMCQFFKKRGYPDSAVTPNKQRVQEIDRETALQNFTEQRKRQNSSHPYLSSTKPINQECHSQ